MPAPDATRSLRVLLVDDEAPARARLRRFLQAEPDVTLLAECCHGGEAVDAIRRERPDAVFLDVQMPRLDGFAVCAAIGPEHMPPVVFVTAFDQYALRAFEVCAVDYLLKPFDQARFRRTLDRLRQRRATPTGPGGPDLQALLQALRAQANPPDRLALKTDGRLVFLRLDEIDRVESDGNYVRFHAGTNTLLVRETLGWCEQQLPPARFLRISRSVIVNLDRIKEIQPLFYGDHAVLLRDGTRLTLSRTHRDRLQALTAANRDPASPGP